MSKLRLDKTGFGDLSIYQDPDDFCYGIDSVILADFVSSTKCNSIVDLGTGNGIIPIILSHKTNLQNIVGVEINDKSCELAKKSIELNQLGHRINIINSDIKNLCLKQEGYEAVVTNPPYFPMGRGIVTGSSAGKATARHEITASFDDFACISSRLLVNRGEFYMVHRPHRTVEIINSLSKYDLEPKVLRYISPKSGEKPNIMLIKAIKNGGPELEVQEPLYVYNSNNTYTYEIMKMYDRV